ncbi:hypothetical protein Rcae01_02682 [Novipirellula caenicola]|uniref:Transposase zinc-ribbon domain-containing protein n=1 Tax=Novipirellula caenicola TaxID=1536901 RepID=A0ABP9VQ05_9BACT
MNTTASHGWLKNTPLSFLDLKPPLPPTLLVNVILHLLLYERSRKMADFGKQCPRCKSTMFRVPRHWLERVFCSAAYRCNRCRKRRRLAIVIHTLL